MSHPLPTATTCPYNQPSASGKGKGKVARRPKKTPPVFTKCLVWVESAGDARFVFANDTDSHSNKAAWSDAECKLQLIGRKSGNGRWEMFLGLTRLPNTPGWMWTTRRPGSAAKVLRRSRMRRMLLPTNSSITKPRLEEGDFRTGGNGAERVHGPSPPLPEAATSAVVPELAYDREVKIMIGGEIRLFMFKYIRRGIHF